MVKTSTSIWFGVKAQKSGQICTVIEVDYDFAGVSDV